MKIAHVTTAHPRYDSRAKMCVSLSSEPLNDVSLVVSDCLGNSLSQNINILDLGIANKRLSRFLYLPFRAFLVIKSLRCQIVHLHDPELYLLSLPLKLSKVHCILDFHEDLPSQILDKHYYLFLRFLFRYYQNYIFCRNFVLLRVILHQ